MPVSGLELFNFSHPAYEGEGVYSSQTMLTLALNHERMVVDRVNVTLKAALDRQDEPGEALLNTMLESSNGRAERLQALLERFN